MVELQKRWAKAGGFLHSESIGSSLSITLSLFRKKCRTARISVCNVPLALLGIAGGVRIG